MDNKYQLKMLEISKILFLNNVPVDSAKIVGSFIEGLEKQNQELKKQLEECYCNRTDCSSRIKDSKQYDSLVQKTEKQQKEFIEYLESEIDTITQQKETFAELDAGQGVYLMTLAIVLEKYKEIIGGNNE